MKLVIAVLAVVVALTASAAIGMAMLDSRHGHHELRPIHYDTHYTFGRAAPGPRGQIG